MEQRKISCAVAAIRYIEAHLEEAMDLTTVAQAVHYSSYYLHRVFTGTVGMTLHDYVRRRRLTEAARKLVFTTAPISLIALSAGYESQQAFTGIFKAMYKRTPLEYRREESFYPLQLPVTLYDGPAVPGAVTVSFAQPQDVPGWMELTGLIIGGFPAFEPEKHRQQLRDCILRRQALVAKDRGRLVGAAAVSPLTGNIDFLGVHPQYRRHGVGNALLSFLLDQALPSEQPVSITTFREGDKADTGQRADYLRLGFVPAEPLVEFGYPTQRLILDRGGGTCCG